MTIEIRRPEVQQLVREEMSSHHFDDTDDLINEALHALREKHARAAVPSSPSRNTGTGADLIAALQASPYREVDIEPARYRPPVRNVAI